MLKDINTVKGRVLNLLEEYPILRDSDKLLFLAYARKFTKLDESLNGTYESYKNWFMEDMPSTESIRRCRQKIQEMVPELRGTKRVFKMKEESVMREWAKL